MVLGKKTPSKAVCRLWEAHEENWIITGSLFLCRVQAGPQAYVL